MELLQEPFEHCFFYCIFKRLCNLICSPKTQASMPPLLTQPQHLRTSSFSKFAITLQYTCFKMCQPFISHPIILFQKAKESLWETFPMRSLWSFHSRIHKLIITPLCHSCNSGEESTSRKSTPRISPTWAINQSYFFFEIYNHT